MAQPVAVLGVEHQEAAAAGADQLAADRAVLHAQLVPFVDLGVAHAARAALLVLPVLVHQLAELGEIAGFQRRLAAQSELLHVVEVRRASSSSLCLRALSWSFRILPALREKAGEEQQQIVFEVEQGVRRDIAAARPRPCRPC